METYSENLKKFKFQCLLCGDIIYKKSNTCKCGHVQIKWNTFSIFHTIIGEEYLLILQNNQWVLFKEFQNVDRLLTQVQLEEQKKTRKILLVQNTHDKNRTFEIRKAKIKNPSNQNIENYYGEPLFETQIEFLNEIEELIGFPLPKKTILRYDSEGFKSSNGYILHLSLYNCGLNCIPSSIKNLTNLRSLYLRTNKISEIPKELYSISTLKLLYLFDNQISEISGEIMSLKNLEVLNLAMNRIKRLPEEFIYLDNLKNLTLSFNTISFLPSGLLKMQSIEEIYVNGNKIEGFANEQYRNNFWKKSV